MQQFYGSGEGPSFVAPPVGSPTHDPISDMMGHYVDVLASKIDDQALDKTARTSINEDPSKGIVSIDVSLRGDDFTRSSTQTTLKPKDKVYII